MLELSLLEIVLALVVIGHIAGYIVDKLESGRRIRAVRKEQRESKEKARKEGLTD